MVPDQRSTRYRMPTSSSFSSIVCSSSLVRSFGEIVSGSAGSVCQYKRGGRTCRRALRTGDLIRQRPQAHVDALRHHEDILQPRHGRLLRLWHRNGAAMQGPEAGYHADLSQQVLQTQQLPKTGKGVPYQARLACGVPTGDHQPARVFRDDAVDACCYRFAFRRHQRNVGQADLGATTTLLGEALLRHGQR